MRGRACLRKHGPFPNIFSVCNEVQESVWTARLTLSTELTFKACPNSSSSVPFPVVGFTIQRQKELHSWLRGVPRAEKGSHQGV